VTVVPDTDLNKTIRALSTSSIETSRREWERRFGEPPPPLRGPDLMRRALADRIQSEAVGCDVDVERRIAGLVRAHLRGNAVKQPRSTARPGTILQREHQGKLHHVQVTAGGFSWEGRTYRSLSQIARAITGVRWNGPKFFGLREAGVSGRQA
jgi:hypothetical protein